MDTETPETHRLIAVDRQLSALADPTRRAVYDIVRATPSSVTAVAKQLPVSQPAVSQHLRVLAEANLVVATPSGARRIYRADPSGVKILRSWIEELWEDVLDAFTDAAAVEAERAGSTGQNPKQASNKLKDPNKKD